MRSEEKLVAAMAKSFISLGFNPPSYPRPRWYQFGLKRRLAYYRKNNWPYRLEQS